ncbi:MAG TPA: rod shape-determining protein [Chthoniobacterales bacterium]
MNRKWSNMLPNLFLQKIGMDLGTSNTVIFLKDIVLREASVVTVCRGKVVAVGDAAKQMLGKTPQTLTSAKPLKNGAIADLELAEEMLLQFIAKARSKTKWLCKWRPFEVSIAIPSEITAVEKRAVSDCARRAGAKEVFLIQEVIAGAIGAGRPVHDAIGTFIVNIGGGTTEIALIALSGIVLAKSVHIAGDAFDEAIIDYVKRRHNLLIGESTAERVKIEVGSVKALEEEMSTEVRGRDLVTGFPKTVTIRSEEVREALMPTITALVQHIKLALEKCPPELSADLVERGLTLAGGGALLRGLDSLISEVTSIPAVVSDDPVGVVASGIGQSMHDRNLYEHTKKHSYNS